MDVLILYDSHWPQIESPAADGVSQVPGPRALDRHIGTASREDLLDADALILALPTGAALQAT